MEFVERIEAKAAEEIKTIVLPEAAEERNIEAANQIIKEGFAKLVLIGNPDQIHHLASEYYLDEIGKATIVDPENNPEKEEYVELMLKLRASKGLTREQAEKLIVDPLYLAALMVKNGDVDGEVAGANNATGDVLRPAFQYVKTHSGHQRCIGSLHYADSRHDVRRAWHDGLCRLCRASQSYCRGVGADRGYDRADGPRDRWHRTAHRDAELLDERLGQK